MKTFHIKHLRDGEQSAAIVGYSYDEASRRTRTIYLGSVRVDANPDHPHRAVRLRPNKSLNGQLVQLTPERLDLVRSWLEEHGTYRTKQRAADEAAMYYRIQLEEQERCRMERIETELRARLESQWRAAFDAVTPHQDPLKLALDVVEKACEFVKAEAVRLREEGGKLSRVRSTQTDVDQCKTELDRLQARANKLRLIALDAFEKECKEAGLMAAQKRGRKRLVA